MLYDRGLEMVRLRPQPQGPAQAADAAPVLPNRDDGQEGETGGESKAGAHELFHGELIDFIIYRGCHHPRHCQGQLQDDKHLSCGRNRGYQEAVLLSLQGSQLAESLGSSEAAPCPSLSGFMAHFTGTPASIQPAVPVTCVGGGSVFLCGCSVSDFLSLSHSPIFTPSALDGHQCVPRVSEMLLLELSWVPSASSNPVPETEQLANSPGREPHGDSCHSP